MGRNGQAQIFLVGEQLAALAPLLQVDACVCTQTVEESIPPTASLLVLDPSSAFTLLPTLKRRIPWILVARNLDRQILDRSMSLHCSDLIAGELEPTELSWRIERVLLQEKARDQLEQERDDLKNLSERDPLTQLFNRRGFQNHVLQSLAQAERLHQPVALILLDIDHFKEINDAHGHPFGDQFLSRCAKLMKEAVRSYDLVARIGGDEFALFLCNILPGKSIRLAREILRNLNETTISSPKGEVPLHASIGIATLHPLLPNRVKPQLVLDQLLHHADQALYDAKEAGRNCLSKRSVTIEQPALKRDPI
jgi:two-component system cell cycle response regulator